MTKTPLPFTPTRKHRKRRKDKSRPESFAISPKGEILLRNKPKTMLIMENMQQRQVQKTFKQIQADELILNGKDEEGLSIQQSFQKRFKKNLNKTQDFSQFKRWRQCSDKLDSMHILGTKSAAQPRVQSVSPAKALEAKDQPRKITVQRPRRPIQVQQLSPKDLLMMGIRNSYGILLDQKEQTEKYKYFIIKGNNSGLINQIFKVRKQWQKAKTVQEANFVWTPVKQQAIFETVFCKTTVNLLDNREAVRNGSITLRMNGSSLIFNSQHFITMKFKDTYSSQNLTLYNKFRYNHYICSKKGLAKTITQFCKQKCIDYHSFLPLTFHVKSIETEAWNKFTKVFNAFNTIWIIKPGENSNQGKGIKVTDSLNTITQILQQKKYCRTYIIQQYLSHPLLISNRKFDIRLYVLITQLNGVMQGFIYQNGYIRTSSKSFCLKSFSNKYIHLTNDAVQKYSEDYGKFESANKLSFHEFQKYLTKQNYNINFQDDIWPKIVEITRISIQAFYERVKEKEKINCFEVFGYDFMVNQDFSPQLIEINTNPSFDLCNPYLCYLIPELLQNVIHIVIDPLFPPQNLKFKQSKEETDKKIADALLRCRQVMSPKRSSLPNDQWNRHTKDPQYDSASPKKLSKSPISHKTFSRFSDFTQKLEYSPYSQSTMAESPQILSPTRRHKRVASDTSNIIMNQHNHYNSQQKDELKIRQEALLKQTIKEISAKVQRIEETNLVISNKLQKLLKNMRESN